MKTLLVKSGVTLGFFFVLSSFISGSDLLEIFQGIDWFYFLCSVLLGFVMLMVSCAKWKIMFREPGKSIGYWELLRIYFIGYFFSNLLPSTVGGDVVRSYYAGNLIKNQAYAAVSIIVERFTGLLFLLFLVIAAPLFHPSSYLELWVFLPACCALLLLLLLFLLWKTSEPVALVERMFSCLVRGAAKAAAVTGLSIFRSIHRIILRSADFTLLKVQRFTGEMTSAVNMLLGNRRFFIELTLLTVLFYCLTWLNVYIAFRAFAIKPDFLGICALVPTIMFIGQVPVTLLGNLGFFEAVFVFYFAQIQIPAAETLAMGLLLRFKILLLGLIGCIIYLVGKEKKMLPLGSPDTEEKPSG